MRSLFWKFYKIILRLVGRFIDEEFDEDEGCRGDELKI